MEFRVQGVGFMGFGVYGLGCRVCGVRVQGVGSGDSRFRV